MAAAAADRAMVDRVVCAWSLLATENSFRSAVGAAAARPAGPHCRAGHGQGLVPVVDAEAHVGVGVLVRARELHQRAGSAAAAPGDLDLEAGHEVLGLVHKRLVDTWSVLDTVGTTRCKAGSSKMAYQCAQSA